MRNPWIGSRPRIAQVLLVALTALAQPLAAAETILGNWGLYPLDGPAGYTTGLHTRDEVANGNVFFGRPIDRGDVPDGARITRVCWFFRDVDPVHEFVGAIFTSFVTHLGTPIAPAGPDPFHPVAYTSSGQAGDQRVCQDTDLLVRRHADVNGDGQKDLGEYALTLNLGGGATPDAVQFYRVRIVWTPPS
jgi:hypothetical protein